MAVVGVTDGHGLLVAGRLQDVVWTTRHRCIPPAWSGADLHDVEVDHDAKPQRT